MGAHNKKPLILLQLFGALGGSMVGIFFPFLVAQAFELSNAELFFIWAAVWFSFAIFVLPLNKILTQVFSTKQMLQGGIMLTALFYYLLSFSSQDPWFLWGTLGVFVLSLIVFWPSYHFVTLHATKSGGRGSFFSYMQMGFVSTKVVAPVVSGYLLQTGQKEYIIWVAIFFFLCSFVTTYSLSVHDGKIKSWSESWRILKEVCFSPDHRWGFLASGLQSGFLHLAWPIYLQVVLGKFLVMGIVSSIAAVFEVISSYFSGKYTDRKRPQDVLKKASWARLVDLGIRVLYLKIQHVFFVTGVLIFTGILGPVFNISYSARIMEIGEQGDDDRSFEFFVVREIFINVVRAILIAFCGIVIVLYGELALGWVLGGVAFMSFGFRRF